MIFGSIDSPFIFRESNVSAKDMVFGTLVTGESFYQALLEYGSFDEYHFVVDPTGVPSFQKGLSQFSCDSHRVKLIKRTELPSYLNRTKYSIFFSCLPGLDKLSYLRGQYSDRCFPICALAHSISYQDFLEDLFFNNMIADLYPFDSLICTSTAQFEAIKNLNESVIDSFRKEKGWALEFGGRLDLLPLGLDARTYGETNAAQARESLHLPKEKIIILYFGRFSIYDKMDLHPLLIAFKGLLREGGNIMLVFAGRDAQTKYGNKIEEMSKEMGLAPNVKFYLNPSLDEKKLIYSACDIFISPSDNVQESFGLTILEAMASGKPVIASDWNGYRDLVIHNETGFLIPTYWADCNRDVYLLSRVHGDRGTDHLHLAQSVAVDIKKMSEYLSILIKDGELRLKFGRNGRNRVAQTFDWRVLIPRYEDLWKELFELSQHFTFKENRTEIFVPKYFECFGHYPSQILTGNMEVTICEDGRTFLRTRKLPYVPGELYERISQRIVFILLAFLVDEEITTIGRLESYAKNILKDVSSDAIMFHVLWLLKKGFIGTAGSALDSPVAQPSAIPS
jgi:D-inositol-3-phosphate glycosyltransferase